VPRSIKAPQWPSLDAIDGNLNPSVGWRTGIPKGDAVVVGRALVD
jgi:hypothetical protein